MTKSWMFFFLITGMFLQHTLAQEKRVQGIIFDLDSKERIAKVYLYNLRSNQGIYNNLKAEFTIPVQVNDSIIISKPGYRNDTVKVANQSALIIYLKRTSIVLREVSIRDSMLNPEKRLKNTKDQFAKIYGALSNRDLLSMGNGQSGAGLSIDALYNIFSRQGKNARKLEKIIDRDYREHIIDYKFNRNFVASITGLTDPALSDFLFKYRPGYYFVMKVSDYDLIAYVRSSFIRFQSNPEAYSLQPLSPKP
ncbi:MAG: hypothetical protein ACOH2A_02740 [Sphingobacteriaceae bacterium]